MKKINKNRFGNILSVGDSLNNVRNGEWIICSGFEKDKVDTAEILNYKNGQLHGLCKKVDSEGNWIFTNWKSGLKHGPEYEITKNGDSLFRGKWINNKAVGTHTTYYYKESIYTEYRKPKNDIDLTNWKWIHFENRIASQSNYNSEGELNGEHLSFDVTGTLIDYGNYKSNNKTGIWLEENKIDNVSSRILIGFYDSGRKNGLWVEYKQKYNYQIKEFESTDQFFLSHRNRIERSDITEEIIYRKGEILKERYFYDGIEFRSKDDLTTYILERFTKNNSKRKTKSTYSF